MRKMLIATALALGIGNVDAAEMNITGKALVGYGTKDVLALSGQIAVGDAEKLNAFLNARKANVADTSSVGRVTFSGRNGDFPEAVRIARLLRENYVQSVILPGDVCADACAVAFMGGSGGPFEGTTVINPARCLQPGGQAVFSLPSFAEKLRTASLQTDKTTIRQARQEAFLFIVQLMQLARDHSWPTALIDEILDEGIGPKTWVSQRNDPLSLLRPAGEDGQSNWTSGIDFGAPCPTPLWN